VTLVHPGRIDTPYNEHAQSYFEHQPTHRGMIYPPESVADAILFAAARDLFVGGQAKALAVAGVLAPSVVDKVMQRYLFWTEHDEWPPIARKDSALHPSSPETAERGSHHGWFRKRSSYLAATTNLAVRRVNGRSSGGHLCVTGLVPHHDPRLHKMRRRVYTKFVDLRYGRRVLLRRRGRKVSLARRRRCGRVHTRSVSGWASTSALYHELLRDTGS